MSTSLNLRMEILKHNNKNRTSFLNGKLNFRYLKCLTKWTHQFYLDELVTIEKLIHLHPLFISLWTQLGDVIYSHLVTLNDNITEKTEFNNHYLVCSLTIKELMRHGYQFRSEIVLKQKQKQKNWVSMKTKGKNICYWTTIKKALIIL